MSQHLLGRLAVKSSQIAPGEGFAVDVRKDQLLQIMSVSGRQVSDFIAFNLDDANERLSTAVTRTKNNSLMLQQGMKLYSNRRNVLFDVIEDTVGRHDMLYPMCDPRRYADDFNDPDHASCQTAFLRALDGRSIDADDLPDPVNWFMNVAVLQRGELEIRESIAEASDYVLLRAEMDALVAISACPQDKNATNSEAPTEILVRVFQ